MSSTGCIVLPHPGLCLDAHPGEPTLAAGLTTGGVVVASAADLPTSPSGAWTKSAITHPFESGCRTVSFTPHPLHFVASTSAGTVLLYDIARRTALQSGTVPTQGQGGDDEQTNATAFSAMDENIIVMGDDNGGLHLIDVRVSCTPVVSVLEQGDYISAITQADAFGTRALLASSGDGSLCAYDFRVPPHPRLKLQYAHDSFNDDLLSMVVLSKLNLVVAGTLSGALNLYNLQFMDRDSENEAAAHIDRFLGHPECVNAIIPVEESGVVLTASTDGIIRVVDVVSKSLVGVLEYDREQTGEEGKEETPLGKKRKKNMGAWPVEDMVSVAGLEKPGFALLGHDEIIRFCDGSILVDDDEKTPSEVDGKEAENSVSAGRAKLKQEKVEEFAATQSAQRRKKKKKRKSTGTVDKGDSGFFDDL